MSRPRHLASTHLAIAFAGFAAASHAQSACLDQQYLGGRTNGLEITANQPVVQTLTCSRAGELRRIDLDVRHHVAGVTAPLDITVLATDANGVPTNQVLATAQVSASDIPFGAAPYVPVRFAQPATVASGQVIGIELSVTAARAYAWWGDAPGGYAAGATFLRRTTGPLSFDLGFRTYVGASGQQSNYGTGHPGTGGVPGLSALTLPQIGMPLDLRVGNSAGAPTPGVLLLGTARANSPTPFGGTLLVQFVVQLGLTLPSSGLVVPFAMPDLPSLCNTPLTLQAAIADPGASHGIAFTPGLELVIGA